MVGRDFNVISKAGERIGSPFNFEASLDFLSFIVNVSLLEIGFSGIKFTWCNNK